MRSSMAAASQAEKQRSSIGGEDGVDDDAEGDADVVGDGKVEEEDDADG